MATKRKIWKPKKSYLAMRAASERIELRAYRASDFEAWRAGHLGRLPKQHRFDSHPPKASLLTPAYFRKKLREHREGAKRRSSFTFGIFERKTGKIVGFIGYNTISPSYQWANLGYQVHSQYWGRGFAPEAARLCLKIGFTDLNYYRIEASCEPENKASAKTALRAGLKPEGRRRKFFPRNGGVDLLVFGENQIDWKRKQRARS